MSDLKGDLEFLNQGLNGEYFGIAASDAALGTGLLSSQVVTVAKGFQADHRAHAEATKGAIKHIGAAVAAPKTWEEYAALYPPPRLATEVDVLRYGDSLERSAAIADTKLVAKLSTAEQRTLNARIGGVEATHWAVLHPPLGEAPIPDSLIPES